MENRIGRIWLEMASKERVWRESAVFGETLVVLWKIAGLCEGDPNKDS